MYLERGPEISSEKFFETLHFYTFEEILMEWMERDLFSLKYLACSTKMHFYTFRICWIDWKLVNIVEAHEKDSSYMVLLSCDYVLFMYQAITFLQLFYVWKFEFQSALLHFCMVLALIFCWIYEQFYMRYIFHNLFG